MKTFIGHFQSKKKNTKTQQPNIATNIRTCLRFLILTHTQYLLFKQNERIKNDFMFITRKEYPRAHLWQLWFSKEDFDQHFV
ncbi:CLUMA_CG016074, isoform A [Clunio marinus]|uniref:CLUMA_CG016074, isoform A n=1 Tax=Clunio marinus TaxID=568069 RepID=A0A1J1IU22_9DIPT|nr:CLUMA_CG016074, isoform A [Clunio marinus]